MATYLKIDDMTNKLLAWYWQEKRDLPWRENRDPYRIWISEIMLQQTRVEAVKPYFHRFMEQFPTIEILAAAPEQQVLKAWEGLGYYSRARNLHAAAKEVVSEYQGVMPTAYEEVRSLPGIGEYTAGAIMSIAYNQPYPAVDGNVLRVFSRWYCLRDDISKAKTKKLITELVQSSIPEGYASDFNQAIMDLGAQICIAKYPRCGICPMSSHCLSHQAGMEQEIPVKSTKKPPLPVIVASIYVEHAGEVLFEQRPSDGMLANMWQLPMEEGKDKAEAWHKLQKRLERMGLSVDSKIVTSEEVIAYEEHIFSHRHWYMTVYAGLVQHQDQHQERTQVVLENKQQYLTNDGMVKWISIDEANNYPMPGIFKKTWERLRGKFVK